MIAMWSLKPLASADRELGGPPLPFLSAAILLFAVDGAVEQALRAVCCEKGGSFSPSLDRQVETDFGDVRETGRLFRVENPERTCCSQAKRNEK